MGPEIKLYFREAKNKRHAEKVIFVHNMLGDHRTTLRHSSLMNELGYDTVSFNLIWGSKHLRPLAHPLALRIPFGIFYIWEKQISMVFDQVPGPKIFYGFSGPSVSALLACQGRSDIKKVICDGGPFRDFKKNTRNLFDHKIGVPYETLFKSLALTGTYLWGRSAERALDKILPSWDPKVPILSLRGSEDPIVPEKTIEAIFSPYPDLPITAFSIPGGKHLDGLKMFPKVYRSQVIQFLS